MALQNHYLPPRISARSMNKAACLVVSCLVWLAACHAPEPRVWQEEDGYRWIDLPEVARGNAGFKQMTAAQTGIDFANRVTGEQVAMNRHRMHGSGVAVGDVDGDGLPDLYFARLDGPNVLYRNRGGWRFEEITDSAGVAAPDRFSTGATFADLEGDGDLDLLLTALGGPNAAFLNDGNGHFQEVTQEAGLVSGRGSTTLALADVEGDGDLDLYVANYKRRALRDSLPPDQLLWDNVVRQDGDRYTIAPAFQDDYDIEMRGTKVLRLERGEPDRFYLNDGAGRFIEVSFTDGHFLDADGEPLRERPHGWALMARFQDFNDDGVPDLYVCNDFESPDHFWLGDGEGGFRMASRLALRKTSSATMAVAVSDIDRDGVTDFFLADMLSPEYSRRQRQAGTQVPVADDMGVMENRPQVMQNTLFLGQGDGTFAEVAHAAGVEASEWTWSSLFLDVDLDGYEDLLIANGHLFDVQDADAQIRERMQIRQTRSFDAFRRLILNFPPLALKNMAFRNLGSVRFEAMPEGWGLGAEADISHGMALGDLDGDGDLDVIINRLNQEAGIYQNTGSAPRVAVRLRGLAPNTQGIGAKVRVQSTGLPMQQQEMIAGGQYLSSSEPLLTFAAADSVAIEVDWRSGRRSRITGARGNRLYEIDEAAAVLPVVEDSTGTPEQPVFADTTTVLGHTHHEDPFDDFARQPLLPWKRSQAGPPLAWADLDGDGDDDLLVGSGRGGRLARYLNQGDGRFVKATIGNLSPGDQVAVVAMPLEEDQQGARIFVAVSNNEGGLDSSYIALYETDVQGAARPVGQLTFGLASIGPLALGDLDGDGDLDLLAGGAGWPGRYPAPAPTRLYRNTNGRFAYDVAWSRAFTEAGVVNSATLGDLDGDGDQDIVLATEVGPVRVFVNEAQQGFIEATESYGLSGYQGFWQGVALGDVDSDGDLDLVATNWGWNTKYGRVEDAAHPLRFYHGDVDGNGSYDILEAPYEPGLGGYVPMRGLNVLSAALPMLRRRVQSYAQFAGATLEEIVGPGLARMNVAEITTLASTVFINQGGSFEAHPLPKEVHYAPGFGVVVADYNSDGNEDVFIGQNFFAVPVEVARLDGGRGLWLRGGGTGTFEAVAGQEAGVTVYGEQRGVAISDYNADGRVDLAVGQNSAATKLYRNEARTSGLRVRLVGPPSNRAGVGAVIRLQFTEDIMGPMRLVTAGSGYRSQSSLVQVLGKGGRSVKGVWVRWPDGHEQVTTVGAGAEETTVVYAEGV